MKFFRKKRISYFYNELVYTQAYVQILCQLQRALLGLPESTIENMQHVSHPAHKNKISHSKANGYINDLAFVLKGLEKKERETEIREE